MPRSATASFLDRLDRALDVDGVFTTREARDVALDQFGWDEGEIFS